MVPLEGQSLNALFDELADIQEQLNTTDIDIKHTFEELGL